MKAKLESDTQIFTKEKNLAIEICKKCGGNISINVEYRTERNKSKVGEIQETDELYVNSIENSLPHNINLFIYSDNNDNILAHLNLSKFEFNDKSKEILQKVNAILKSYNCKII